MRHTDRHQQEFAAASSRAAYLYREAIDALLGLSGRVDALFQDLLREDPDSALGRIALARLRQTQGRAAEARAQADRAVALSDGLSPREVSHVAALASVVRAEGRIALERITAHMEQYPRDVLVLAPVAGVFGLFGFSGESGREQALHAYLDRWRDELADDWWFAAAMAFAAAETGRLDEAREEISRAWALNPQSANTAHIRAHVEYEHGSDRDTLAWLGEWLAGYPREGLMHCHLGWHVALARLRLGDLDRALEASRRWVEPIDELSGEGAWGPPLNLVTDAISLLFRAHLRGASVPLTRWKRLHAAASSQFPKAGLRFADFHLLVCAAVLGDQLGVEQRVAGIPGPMGVLLANTARGLDALLQSRWGVASEALKRTIGCHEIIGGSRAQRDLLHEAWTYAKGEGRPLPPGFSRPIGAA